MDQFERKIPSGNWVIMYEYNYYCFTIILIMYSRRIITIRLKSAFTNTHNISFEISITVTDWM